jgi:hypothetical protein
MAVSVGISGPQIVSLQIGNDYSTTLIRVAAVNQLVIPHAIAVAVTAIVIEGQWFRESVWQTSVLLACFQFFGVEAGS